MVCWLAGVHAATPTRGNVTLHVEACSMVDWFFVMSRVTLISWLEGTWFGVLDPIAAGLMDACADRGDTDGALEVLDAMRDGEKGMKDILPRPSYRPFLAALRACSREALACLPASEATEVVDGDAEVPDTSPDGAVGGDWRACKRVLEMMWADETARMAEQQAAVPGAPCVLDQRHIFGSFRRLSV